jgi:anti-anti-sigma regulatory factor
MTAAISVLAADDTGSAAVLHGTFDFENQWFLTKHLDELDGDVVIDLRHVDGLDDASIDALREFCVRAAAERRRVVFRSLRPDVWASLSSIGA